MGKRTQEGAGGHRKGGAGPRQTDEAAAEEARGRGPVAPAALLRF